jgi:hypothetical protein
MRQPPQDPEGTTLRAIRRLLAALLAVGMVGTGAELLLIAPVVTRLTGSCSSEPTDSQAVTNCARRRLLGRTFDQLVRQALVIPLAMIVRGELLQCSCAF